MKTVTIVRNRGWYGFFRGVRIVADNLVLGSVHAGESLEVRIPDGASRLLGKIDWASTPGVPVGELCDGDTLYLNAYLSLNPLSLLGVKALPLRFERSGR
jgi:hypothetical protein